jgi:hypothetical protein
VPNPHAIVVPVASSRKKTWVALDLLSGLVLDLALPDQDDSKFESKWWGQNGWRNGTEVSVLFH